MNEIESIATRGPPRPLRILEAIAKILALLGGAVAIAVAIIVVASVLSRWLFSNPIPGDFELAQIGTAVAAFAFLPYCQVMRGNIVVDTFTAHLPARLRGRMDAIWDFVYGGGNAVCGACPDPCTFGSLASQEVSMVLRIPVWPGVAFGALCCAFLAIVSLATAYGLARNKP